MFSDPKVEKILDAYEARRTSEENLMRELGAKGFARRDEFLLPIGLDVGRFLHALILVKNPKLILEVGTSYGYSTLFLADAVKQYGGRIVSLELQEYKQNYARDRLNEAGLNSTVEYYSGDAIKLITKLDEPVDFALIDIWKELYVNVLEVLYSKLSDKAVVIADNMIIPEQARVDVQKYRNAVAAKSDLQSVLLPIGCGIEVSVRWGNNSSKL